MRSLPVKFRRTDLLAVDGDQPLAFLSGGFGDELFEPRAEIGDAGRREDGHFVAPAPCEAFRGSRRESRRGFRSAGTTDAQAWTISSVRSRNFAMSIPCIAPGIIPKFESAE